MYSIRDSKKIVDKYIELHYTHDFHVTVSCILQNECKAWLEGFWPSKVGGRNKILF